MSKYIDADKLIAKIEQELSAHNKVDHLEAQEVGKAWSRGHRRALEEMLDFITSLQQEQPHIPSNIDDAANTFNREDAARMWDYEGKTEGEIVEAAFKAGAEWMKGQFQARKEK